LAFNVVSAAICSSSATILTPLIDLNRAAEPLVLHLIAYKVFQHGTYATLLETAYIGRTDDAGEIRVLREGFESLC
jgi:hypothetical protein